MKYKINSIKEYHQTMVEVYELMNKGEKKLSKEDMNKLSVMSEAAEKYEDEVLKLKPIKAPQSIPEMVELKMFEKKITQSKLSENLGISKSKVSEILSGKRKLDTAFLKGIHKTLDIDADFLLKHL